MSEDRLQTPETEGFRFERELRRIEIVAISFQNTVRYLAEVTARLEKALDEGGTLSPRKSEGRHDPPTLPPAGETVEPQAQPSPSGPEEEGALRAADRRREIRETELSRRAEAISKMSDEERREAWENAWTEN